MNNIIISGEVVGDVREELNKELYCCKFKIKNNEYSYKKSRDEIIYLDCICYGNVARYVYNELYEGCKILITGRILTRHYVVNGSGFYKYYIGCNTVTKLEQEDYE